MKFEPFGGHREWTVKRKKGKTNEIMQKFHTFVYITN